MSRSVSTPSNTHHVEYSVIPSDRYWCSQCGETFNEYGQQDEEPCCPHCAATASECSERDTQDDWEFYKDDLIEQMQREFPSLDTCDTWLGREDHALLENRFCHIGVSEYCGLVAIWMTPKDPKDRDSEGWVNVRDRWVHQVGPKFSRTARTCFGQPVVQVARLSNGECLFQAA